MNIRRQEYPYSEKNLFINNSLILLLNNIITVILAFFKYISKKFTDCLLKNLQNAL
jgi:hypothetical protein